MSLVIWLCGGLSCLSADPYICRCVFMHLGNLGISLPRRPGGRSVYYLGTYSSRYVRICLCTYLPR